MQDYFREMFVSNFEKQIFIYCEMPPFEMQADFFYESLKFLTNVLASEIRKDE